MGSEPPKKVQPEKTLKQQIKENCKEINKMRREFQRQTNKLELTDKKLNRDLKKAISSKQPSLNKKSLAQAILKNQRFIQRYKNLDAQLQNTIFQLQSMATMEQMQNVMNGLANIMGNAKNKIKIEQFQKSIKTYTTEKERMQAINEMVQDTMELDEDEIDDTDVDKLILGMQDDVKNKKMKQMDHAEQDEQAA